MNSHILALAVIMPITAVIAANTAFSREPGIPRGQKTFERLDKNKNGKLELNELQPAAVRRFMKLDVNADRMVSRGEVEDWLRAMMERRLERIMTRMDADDDKGPASGSPVVIGVVRHNLIGFKSACNIRI